MKHTPSHHRFSSTLFSFLSNYFNVNAFIIVEHHKQYNFSKLYQFRKTCVILHHYDLYFELWMLASLYLNFYLNILIFFQDSAIAKSAILIMLLFIFINK